MDQTRQNIQRLIDIRDKAVVSEDEKITKEELLNLAREALQLAKECEILDQSKYETLQQLRGYELRSFSRFLESEMTMKSLVENLIFFCVSIITIIYGKLDI
ncbi:MAG: hypothetical protein V5A47_09255 [Bacteroidales bacterium]|nr:hypothetical protein [Bacteroidales bacterium]MBS3774692.1 hypothetical protein [Bacteroidales bacterium]